MFRRILSTFVISIFSKFSVCVCVRKTSHKNTYARGTFLNKLKKYSLLVMLETLSCGQMTLKS